jgi:oxygen-independent coproporphyrinogen-3 oxidase
VEQLDQRTKCNEYLMTRLRTAWGVDLNVVRSEYGVDLLSSEKESIAQWMEEGLMIIDNNTITLTTEGLLKADRIASDLFILES